MERSTLAAIRSSRGPGSRWQPLLDLAAACYDELCMQPGALLAVRDGEHGSYLYSRPAPEAPIRQWLVDPACRDFEWFACVPAAELDGPVVDPTGAGNAYAGAICAQLAAGAHPAEAAAAASAVGAAFCAEDDWAPSAPAEETRRWVARASKLVQAGIKVISPSASDTQLS